MRTNDKRPARLNIIKDLLDNKRLIRRLHYSGKDKKLIRPDQKIVFAYHISNLENGQVGK